MVKGKAKPKPTSTGAGAAAGHASAGAAAAALPPCLHVVDSAVQIAISAKPNAKSSEVTDLSDTVGVKIAARPVEGEANEELVRFFTEILHAKKKQVSLGAGAKSRDKVIVVTEMAPELVLQHLRAALPEGAGAAAAAGSS